MLVLYILLVLGYSDQNVILMPLVVDFLLDYVVLEFFCVCMISWARVCFSKVTTDEYYWLRIFHDSYRGLDDVQGHMSGLILHSRSNDTT